MGLDNASRVSGSFSVTTRVNASSGGRLTVLNILTLAIHARSETQTSPYFEWLGEGWLTWQGSASKRSCRRSVTPADALHASPDPLWTPAQRFRLDCKQPRQKGQASNYLAKECQIIVTEPTSPEQHLCLGTAENPPETNKGALKKAQCDGLAESFWNIRKWPRTAR